MTHQLVRHRIASYSQQSQRYVKEHNFETIMPPTIAAKQEAQAKFIKAMQDLQALYNDLTENYQIPAEDARYVLPMLLRPRLCVRFVRSS